MGESTDSSHPEYVKIIWKKQKERCRGILTFSNGESQRLETDGTADLSKTRGEGWYINKYNCADANTQDKDKDKDTQGDLGEELSVNNSNSPKNLKQQAGEDEEGPAFQG